MVQSVIIWGYFIKQLPDAFFFLPYNNFLYQILLDTIAVPAMSICTNRITIVIVRLVRVNLVKFCDCIFSAFRVNH